MISEHASPLAVLGGADAGGQNVHVAALASTLADAGHVVDVYTRRDDLVLPDRVPLRPGVDVVRVTAGPPAFVPRDELAPFMVELGDRIAKDWEAAGAPDVVHSHFWMSGVAALRALQAFGERPRVLASSFATEPTSPRALALPPRSRVERRPPLVATYHALGTVKRRHQGAADTSPRERVKAEARLGRVADAIIATCSDEVRELERLGIPPSSVRVVPCGVDAEMFAPGATSPVVPPRTHRRRLVSVGRLVERKGVDLAVRALVELPDAELVIAGGPDAEELENDPEAVRLTALARSLGVADRVLLLGRVAHEDVPALLCSADVVVATPWYEPFGIVPVEAAACGVPVVGAAVGGLLDTVLDGVTGRLVPPRDPAALAIAVRELLAHPERATAYGEAARKRVLDRYTWERVGIATAAVYQQLLDADRLHGAGRRSALEPGAAELDAGAVEQDPGAAELDAGAVEQDPGAVEQDPGAVEQDPGAVERGARAGHPTEAAS